MRTVRGKLLLVVAACVIPAILAAWFRTVEAEDDLMEEVRSGLERADAAFIGELEEDLDALEMTLGLLGADPRLISDLVTGDTDDIRTLIAAMGRGAEVAIAVVDRTGRIVAAGGGLTDPAMSLDSLALLLRAARGEHVHTFLPFHLRGGRVYALTLAEPIRHEGAPVGALVLARPMDADFLGHVRKLGKHWAITVNGELVAASPDHPAPTLAGSGAARVEQGEQDSRFYAMSSFRPALLQRPGQEVVVTALHDVTGLRDEMRRDLLGSLGILGAALVLAVALSLRIGHRMATAIQRIAGAALWLRRGVYLTADGIRTGDELEQLATAFNEAVAGLRERDQLKETFGKYVTRQVADQILKTKAVLGGETIPVTVVFADIRGFTALSERMDPKALLDFLNVFFSGMVDCVMAHHGVVDKFIGDAIMAVFGAPVPHPEDAIRAIRAALDMRARLAVLNEGFAARGLPTVQIGIGIHSGTVVAGNMGHAERMEYTVIGDPVNVASRLEGLTKQVGADILLSEDTYLKVREWVVAEPLARMQVRGREQPVQVYQLLRAREPVSQAA